MWTIPDKGDISGYSSKCGVSLLLGKPTDFHLTQLFHDSVDHRLRFPGLLGLGEDRDETDAECRPRQRPVGSQSADETLQDVGSVFGGGKRRQLRNSSLPDL